MEIYDTFKKMLACELKVMIKEISHFSHTVAANYRSFHSLISQVLGHNILKWEFQLIKCFSSSSSSSWDQSLAKKKKEVKKLLVFTLNYSQHHDCHESEWETKIEVKEQQNDCNEAHKRLNFLLKNGNAPEWEREKSTMYFFRASEWFMCERTKFSIIR